MKVGVIGTGNMGENHIRTYLSMNNDCQLIGIYDDDEQKMRQTAGQYNVEPFQSVDDLLEAVDAVSIAVPTEFHYVTGLACIRHNVHMLMEKPLTSTVDEADDLIKKASEAGVKLQTGHIELYNPIIQVLTALLKHETINGMTFHRISPADIKLKKIDVVKDLMIHDIYILNEWLRDSALELNAFGKTIQNTPKHAAAVIRSSQGLTAQLTASFMSDRKVRTIQILTENAFIEADILNKKISLTRTFDEQSGNYPIPVSQTIRIGDSVQPLYLQLMDFINCIKSGSKPSVSGQDGRQALMTANRITDSITRGDDLRH